MFYRVTEIIVGGSSSSIELTVILLSVPLFITSYLVLYAAAQFVTLPAGAPVFGSDGNAAMYKVIKEEQIFAPPVDISRGAAGVDGIPAGVLPLLSAIY